MNYDPLNAGIDRVTSKVFPSTFDEIYSQFSKEYGRGAIGKLATAFTGKIPPSQSGFARGSEQYKAADRAYNTARRQIERHVTGQYKSFTAAGQEKLREIGQALNPVRKDVPGGLTVTLTFKAPADRSHAPRERTAVIEMSAVEAFDFVNTVPQPEYYDLFYLWAPDSAGAYGEGGDYEVDILDVEVDVAY